MRVDQLNSAQLELFSKEAIVTNTCLGGRKFQAKLEIDSKKQKIIGSAKAVYRQIEKTGQNQEIFNRFHAVEIKTRDKTVFSKQLNILQKIYYFIVKALLGLDFKDTWSNKFIWYPEQIEADVATGDRDFGSRGYAGPPQHRLVAKKIQNAFKAFNGMSSNFVIVDVCGGRGAGFGVGLVTPESIFRLSGYDKPEWAPNIEKQFFRKEIFNNPKALIVSLCYAPGNTPGAKGYQDPTIPEDITCSVYHMNRKEFDALPHVSGKLKKFMNEFNSKNASELPISAQ